jgi:hypothetical protein
MAMTTSHQRNILNTHNQVEVLILSKYLILSRDPVSLSFEMCVSDSKYFTTICRSTCIYKTNVHFRGRIVTVSFKFLMYRTYSSNSTVILYLNVVKPLNIVHRNCVKETHLFSNTQGFVLSMVLS